MSAKSLADILGDALVKGRTMPPRTPEQQMQDRDARRQTDAFYLGLPSDATDEEMDRKRIEWENKHC